MFDSIGALRSSQSMTETARSPPAIRRAVSYRIVGRLPAEGRTRRRSIVLAMPGWLGRMLRMEVFMRTVISLAAVIALLGLNSVAHADLK